MTYECLLAGLPELQSGEKAPMTMEALEALLAETLTEADTKQLRLMQLRATKGACAFVRDWVAFNTDLNNVLTAEVCRKHGLDPHKFTIGEMPDDVEPEVKELSTIADLYERERKQDAIRFAWLEERTRGIYFSLENILAYYLQMQMLCRWDALNVETGETVFRELVADFKKGITL